MSFRRDFISKPIFAFARGAMPAMSDTEREALEAGDVWWDADLFTGNPDWSKLLATAPATLTIDFSVERRPVPIRARARHRPRP